MKTFVALAVCGLATFAVASPKGLKAQIAKSNGEFTKLMKAKDVDGMAALMAPMVTKDFKHVENGVETTFDQMVTSMKQGFTMMGSVTSCSATTLTFKQMLDTATCTTRHKFGYTTKGADGKSHAFTFAGTTKDDYRKEGADWKMSKMTWLKQAMTMDGKPFNPGNMMTQEKKPVGTGG